MFDIMCIVATVPLQVLKCKSNKLFSNLFGKILKVFSSAAVKTNPQQHNESAPLKSRLIHAPHYSRKKNMSNVSHTHLHML